MNKTLATLTLGALASTLLLAPRDAHALGPIDLEIGAKGGFGTNPSDGTTNPLGVGLGGRAGVSFMKFYGGLNAVYYLGGSQDVLGTSVSLHSFLYGVEAGYGISLLDILTIRPQLGVGNATFSTSGGGQSQSSSYLYLEPGVTGLVSLGGFFVGADANLLAIPSVETGVDTSGNKTTKTYTAFTMHAQVGLKF